MVMKKSFTNVTKKSLQRFREYMQKHIMKAEGTIDIHGMCPSRIIVNISSNEVMVTLVETHVGHGDEIKTKRLSGIEQKYIVEKLAAGVPKDRIIQDARQVQDGKIQRKNITRGDLAYLTRKLFKQIGESYPGLDYGDFAVAYMNNIMEKKLRDFNIICIDGTHGTNRRRWDLTILIKDENNMGFPVIFLLSNRLDQKIQEIFFRSLYTRLGGAIEAEYIIHDPKYYNAWTQVMNTVPKPGRLRGRLLQMKNFVKSLDKDSLQEFKDVYRKFKNHVDCDKMVKKRKIEK